MYEYVYKLHKSVVFPNFFLFWTLGETNLLKQKAYYTCLHFYNVAIPPIEHHTDITTLAATHKLLKVAMCEGM